MAARILVIRGGAIGDFILTLPAIKLLRDLRNSERIHALVREIGQLENDADRVYRKADAAMFASLVLANGSSDGSAHHAITPMDILTLIKWREIYEWLEETVDACKHVANVISEIVIKVRMSIGVIAWCAGIGGSPPTGLAPELPFASTRFANNAASALR